MSLLKNKPVVIFGVKDTAELAHFYLTHDSDKKVVAFTVHERYLEETTFHNLPVVPFEQVKNQFPSVDYLYIFFFKSANNFFFRNLYLICALDLYFFFTFLGYILYDSATSCYYFSPLSQEVEIVRTYSKNFILLIASYSN